ncbi:hypothetical protein PIB30_031198 [Stylosanthes scabra]|uniref:Uncharacterized protein n=1 Tax=Stylosanthes scabra TaxID=79078 RepID=A0ABU6RCJ5_9FABA|nr:hypothetical protein [Stylosanthes scabra]
MLFPRPTTINGCANSRIFGKNIRKIGMCGGFVFHLSKAVYCSSFSGAFREVPGVVFVNMLRVSGKFAAWSILSSTLTYAFYGAFHDGKERDSYIADAIAAGLLSVRRGLPAAAALARLTGSVEFLGSGLIMINYFLLDVNQTGYEKCVEHVDDNISETQEVVNTDKNMIEAQEDNEELLGMK